ncbi:MAG: hypothetical protein HXX18_01545 [Bacteroidetes bacterium]|nr:hypothetical protein [Bacteroidota bacterium]
MKLTKITSLLCAFAMVGLFTTSCSKDEKDEKTPDSSSVQQLVKDDVVIESSFEDAMNDANDVLSKSNSKEMQSMPCNATVDSLIVSDTVTYTITFNGLNCAGTKTKVGKLIIKKNITTPWSQALTTVNIRFDSLKVTKVSNGNWVILNGTKSWQNVSGGLVKNLIPSSNPVIYKINGSIQATFNDNTTRTWNIARQLTYTGNYSTHELLLSVEGFGSADGYSNLVVWGTNRHNESFYTQITHAQTVVHKQSCGWNPISGVKTHKIPSDNKSATITFGFDNNNQPISGTACPDRLKIDWIKGSYSGTMFLDLP